MLALTESTIYQGAKVIGSFFWTRNTGKRCFLEKILQIFKSNLPCEDDITEKWKVQTLKLNFHAAFKNVVVSDAAPWESAALTTIFSKSQKWTFWKKIFFFAPWHQGKEWATILIVPTVESYLDAMKKHQKLASSEYPQQLMLHKQLWPHHHHYFLAFSGNFWRI